LATTSDNVLPLPSLNVQKQEVTDTHYLNVLEIMNKLITIILCAAMFTLGMTVAFYIALYSEPCKVYEIQNRCLNYTDKDCYSKIDIELIVFGKALDHE
jgi:hypothetical protein